MNNLINIYAYAVAENLPTAQREDVIKELKATIQDMVANRDEDEAKALQIVLEELGDPALLAQSYAAKPSYLIGPKYFSLYRKVLTGVVSFAFPITLAVVFITGIASSTDSVLSLVWNSIWAGINMSIMFVFWATLAFIAIERNELKIPELDQKWTIDQLPKHLPIRQITRVEAILEIATNLFAIGFLVYLANTPLFNSASWNPIWVLFLFIPSLEVIHQMFMLQIGNWTKPMLISGLIIKSMFIIAAIILATTPDLINPEIVKSISEHGVENATYIVRLIISIVAGSIILITAWEMVQAVRLHLAYRRKLEASA